MEEAHKPTQATGSSAWEGNMSFKKYSVEKVYRRISPDTNAVFTGAYVVWVHNSDRAEGNRRLADLRQCESELISKYAAAASAAAGNSYVDAVEIPLFVFTEFATTKDLSVLSEHFKVMFHE